MSVRLPFVQGAVDGCRTLDRYRHRRAKSKRDKLHLYLHIQQLVECFHIDDFIFSAGIVLLKARDVEGNKGCHKSQESKSQ